MPKITYESSVKTIIQSECPEGNPMFMIPPDAATRATARIMELNRPDPALLTDLAQLQDEFQDLEERNHEVASAEIDPIQRQYFHGRRIAFDVSAVMVTELLKRYGHEG